jgi:hypothetical protein
LFIHAARDNLLPALAAGFHRAETPWPPALLVLAALAVVAVFAFADGFFAVLVGGYPAAIGNLLVDVYRYTLWVEA